MERDTRSSGQSGEKGFTKSPLKAERPSRFRDHLVISVLDHRCPVSEPNKANSGRGGGEKEKLEASSPPPPSLLSLQMIFVRSPKVPPPKPSTYTCYAIAAITFSNGRESRSLSFSLVVIRYFFCVSLCTSNSGGIALGRMTWMRARMRRMWRWRRAKRIRSGVQRLKTARCTTCAYMMREREKEGGVEEKRRRNKGKCAVDLCAKKLCVLQHQGNTATYAETIEKRTLHIYCTYTVFFMGHPLTFS